MKPLIDNAVHAWNAVIDAAGDLRRSIPFEYRGAPYLVTRGKARLVIKTPQGIRIAYFYGPDERVCRWASSVR